MKKDKSDKAEEKPKKKRGFRKLLLLGMGVGAFWAWYNRSKSSQSS